MADLPAQRWPRRKHKAHGWKEEREEEDTQMYMSEQKEIFPVTACSKLAPDLLRTYARIVKFVDVDDVYACRNRLYWVRQTSARFSSKRTA
jgi:hypothetical protein